MKKMDRSTGILYWLITIGVWVMAAILDSCALLGCGGADFVLDAPSAPDAEAADAAPDAHVGIPEPDAADAADAADARAEADARPQSDAGPSDAASPDANETGCTPWPTSTALCPRIHLAGYPAQIPYTIPDQYCVVLYDGPFPTADPPGTPVIMTMPAACRCAPPPQSAGYTTACLTNEAPAVCPPGSTFHGSGGIFADDAGTESEIICYGTGGGR